MNETLRLPCLWCSGKDYQPWFSRINDRLRYAPGEWSFFRCLRCGSGNLFPRPTLEDISHFYPPVYTFSLEEQPGLSRMAKAIEYRLFFHPQYRAQQAILLRGIGWNRCRGLRLLDVGCGSGLRLVGFRNRGFEVTGMDFEETSVTYVRDRLNIPAVCSSTTGLPTLFPPNSFDVVTAYYVLEHIHDVTQTLSACHQILKPGGWFAAAVPLIDSLQASLLGRRWSQVTEAPRHLSIPSQKGLTSALVASGFTQVKVLPDAALTCAGALGLSIFPGASATSVYGSGQMLAAIFRLLAAGTTLLAWPWCLVENYVFRKPSLGVVFGKKPV